jgi:predicted CXXCH cytochrome family protein
MKPIFDGDCVSCHNNSFAAGRYSMSTYAAVLRDVVPGSASSRLVVWTQPGGTMYRYFTGDRATKAALVRAWVVDNKAAQTR